MKDDNAKALGNLLRKRREALRLSTRALAARADVNDATVVRIEQGAFTAPAPDKLARIAAALDVPLADVYALAEYAVPSELPNFQPYLRTKYRSLPPDEVQKIEQYAQRIAKRHGVDLAGPKPGEDEA